MGSYPGKKKRKRRVLRKFDLLEISAVDTPAQEGARMTLLKRDDSEDEDFDKRLILLSDEGGHSHLVDDSQEGGHTSHDHADGAEMGHSHPWVKSADGTIVVGAADGHSHNVTEKRVSPSGDVFNIENDTENSPMSDETNTAQLEERLASLEAELEAAKAFGQLTDVEKQFCQDLSDTDRQTFISKSASDRQSQIEKAQSSNPVVFTDSEGHEYRKNDDPSLVRLAKRADQERQEREELLKRLQDQDLEKRASELEHIKGDLSDRKALLKALDTIEDSEQRTRVVEIVKSKDRDLAKAFGEAGVGGGDGEDQTADDKLDALAKARQDKDGISFAKAYDLVLETPEGQALYAESNA